MVPKWNPIITNREWLRCRLVYSPLPARIEAPNLCTHLSLASLIRLPPTLITQTYPCRFFPYSSPLVTHHSTKEYTLDKCKILAEKASSVNDLPYQCKRYPEAIKAVGHPPAVEATELNRQDTSGKDAYLGMTGGRAAQANKSKGLETHAQIQRRLTNSRRFTKQA